MPSTRSDARSSGGDPNHPLIPFRTRNAYEVDGSRYALMDATRQPTDLGWWLLRHMAAQTPPLKQNAFAKAIGVGPSSVSRWIYENIQPDLHLLIRAADVLGGSRTDLLQLAGYGDAVPTTAPPATPDHPLVARVRRVLADDSPISHEDRATLEAVIAGVLAPYDHHPAQRHRRTG